MALLLSITDFRFGKYLYRRLQTLFFDDELAGGMEKVNRFYLPLIVATAGVVAVVGLTLGKMADSAVLLAILAWLIADILIVSPLVYLAFLPKPVWKHIRDLDSLTEEERKYYLAERGKNARIEKMMKRYGRSGGDWQ